MSDKFSTISIKYLFHLLLSGKDIKQIFGIPQELFFVPNSTDPFQQERFGQRLETPIGVAAGPHTQMAQNIISAWLCGARYIELKTIQTLDELEISKPCIDMQDEGYNCEWSQELKIKESYNEYLNAWILIHALKNLFGWEGDLGTIFNMSVGYNLEGILKDNVQWFFDKMKDCSIEKEQKIEEFKAFYPRITEIDIPDTISDNITLSTMHGCPPDEIEKIAKYLIEEKKLHTIIKLNPTLLGPDDLRSILNKNLGFKTEVPDIAFEHDLKYNDAISMIKVLSESAKKNKVHFGVKLTNTLESVNNKYIFGKEAEMMYMSGRALHPISVNLAKKLQNEFNGTLDISFSAGADCFNISDLISCGMKPVTMSSDILKPGGYGRLSQYLDNLRTEFQKHNAKDIDGFIAAKDGTSNLSIQEAALLNLNKYAGDVLKNDAYKNKYLKTPTIKTSRKLNAFDCIMAPCVNTCPTHQDIPEYLHLTSKGDFEGAFRVILRTNPLPSVLGMVCDHLCQLKCTRINYDNSLLIRDIKRFVSEKQSPKFSAEKIPSNGLKAAIIGAGPSGLSCAHFLALSGFKVSVYESKSIPGGMVSDAIPSFRLTDKAILEDIERIKSLGVEIHYDSLITKERFDSLSKTSDFIYIAVGAQKAKALDIKGEDAFGVIDPLKFLSDVRRGHKVNIGTNIAIVGGGNTAMDAARTALRIAGKNSSVSIIYRRTIEEMPADADEIKAVLEEGIVIRELLAPEEIEIKDNKAVGLKCSKMILSEPDESGRARPIKIDGSEHILEFDTIIPAIGQDIVIDFAEKEIFDSKLEEHETMIPNVLIGGDALRGPSTVIRAVADGRMAAEKIIRKAGNSLKGIDFTEKNISYEDLMIKKAKRQKGISIPESSSSERDSFDLVVNSLTDEQAVTEAGRCLYCDEVCSICETVCPNRANVTLEVEPVKIMLQKAVKENNEIRILPDETMEIKQKYQIINIGDFCNECGNCTTFCPTQGAPYKEKPKMYLTFNSFNKAEHGYFINQFSGNKTIMHKSKDGIETLTKAGDLLLYDTDKLVAKINAGDFTIQEVSFKKQDMSVAYFHNAATMSILIDVVKDMYFYEHIY